MIKRLISLVLCMVLVMCAVPLGVAAYQNPLADSEGKIFEGGDPYILKYNGIFYLYMSEGNIKSWSSKDLVNWKSEGELLDESLDKKVHYAMYAPEVYYLDGAFYMYGAPFGKGHYVYKSDKPTGPFKLITENTGRQFDGTVFTDGDNTRYFLWCGSGGVNYTTLTSPTTFVSNNDYFKVSVADLWTEGPTMFKRNGTYYLTYTGNNVLLPNYRVEYAVSDDLQKGFTEPENNVLTLNTEGEIKGLGHNSILVGPDLDTYYIIYHDTYKVTGTNADRHIDLDKILFNGTKPYVQGQSSHEVADPDMPDFAVWFEKNDTSEFETGQSWEYADGFISAEKGDKISLISKKKTEKVYSAEMNLYTTDNSGYAAAVFAYTDNKNYGRVYLDQKSASIKTEFIKDGTVLWSESSPLNDGFAYNANHAIKVQQTEDTTIIYLDGTEKSRHAMPAVGGAIGYIAENSDIKVGYTAFSDKAMGSADYDTEKVVPGNNDAVHANNVKDLTVTPASYGKTGSAVAFKKGQFMTFDANVKADGVYSFDITLGKVEKDTTLAVTADNVIKAGVKIPESKKNEDAYNTYSVRNISLKKGKNTVKLYLEKGGAEVYQVHINDYTETTKLANSCDSLYDKEGKFFFKSYENPPSFKDGKMGLKKLSNYGKVLVGKSSWGDYSIEADMTYLDGSTAGIIVRTNQFFDNIEKTTDQYEHNAYYIGFSNKGIFLEKHFQSEKKTLLKLNKGLVKMGTYHIKVTCVGSTITCFVDDTELFSYTDTSNPYMSGAAGFRAAAGSAEFDNLYIAPLESDLKTVSVSVPDMTLETVAGNSGSNAIPFVGIGLGAAVIIAVGVLAVLLINKKRKGV